MLGAENFEPIFDFAPKEVGDKVMLCDTSYLNYFIDAETDIQLSKDREAVSDEVKELFTSQPLIVVANNLNKVYNCGHCDHEHIHDLIVYVPATKQRFFCSTKEVKHVLTETVETK